MLVFGDQARSCDPRAAIRALAGELPVIAAMRPGLARHARLVGAFIAAGELAQGLADHAHPAIDGRGVEDDAAMRVLVALAAAIDASWTSGFAAAVEPAGAAVAALAALAAGARGGARVPDVITCRRAEGHAFYALYPEAYLVAAHRAPPGPRHVIGIRSIGAGLAALVAAATHAALPSTVRPRGDPFDRRVEVARALRDEWLADRSARLAIVDEGPGLSGSSFGAVLDLLEAAGVGLDRLECFPGHAGALGPAASGAHRARWPHLARHVVELDALLLRDGTLARWLAALVGPLTGPLEDLSAGAWRARHFRSEAEWPAAVRAQERRKLLVPTRSGPWLARFVGLGPAGDHALDRARTLHRAGFTPEVAGLCHGFLVERWLDAAPLSVARLDPGGRRRLIERAGSYLGFRARAFPAARDRGASLARLAEMAVRNTTLALGTAIALPGAPAALALRTRPIEIDGRLHAWEWLVARDGALTKTDAVDHHAAHDLVGCQDVAWDVAGAVVELGLSAAEQHRLIAIVGEASGAAVDPELLALLRPCYLAFQLGRHALAEATDAGEAPRLRAAARRYAALLAAG